MDSSRSSGHSFCIRATTAAAKLGVSNSMIKYWDNGSLRHSHVYANALGTAGAEVGYVVWWGFSG